MASNIAVFEAFARGEEAVGRSVRSVRGGGGSHVLYSYETPVAYRHVLGAYFDERTYSATTAKQMGQARAACERLHPARHVETVRHGDFRLRLEPLVPSLAGARP